MRRHTVFLDWGGTLAQVPDEFSHPWKVWAHLLATREQPPTEDQIRLALEVVDRELGNRIYAYLGKSSEFWKAYDGRVMDVLGIRARRADLEESLQQVFEDPSLVRLYPETPTVLAALRNRGYRTGLISNHNDSLLRVLQHHHLKPLLDTVTYSQEAGAEKPDPAVFALALRRAGTTASDAVHVGDSIEADVEGARAVGIHPIWLNRRRLDCSPGCPTIASLSELVPTLDAMSEARGNRLI